MNNRRNLGNQHQRNEEERDSAKPPHLPTVYLLVLTFGKLVRSKQQGKKGFELRQLIMSVPKVS